MSSLVSENWTAGYVADITYTYGFYRELSPQLLGFAMLAQGARAPALDTPVIWCELGCGQGLSANILAAANPHSHFYATDFNPAQIAGARRLAENAGLSNITFFDHAFADFTEEPALPDRFDIIALHGIYSWINAENRSHIVEFILKKLRPGGIVYISYNTLPGWAAAMPLRELMVRSASGRAGPITDRIENAIEHAKTIRDSGADFFSKNPSLGERLDNFAKMSRNYLAHEYFNKDWTPFYFEDVAADLSVAKLTFAASAHVIDQIDVINLTGDQAALLAAEKDPMRRQTLRDFMINQQFRRDIFSKGLETFSIEDSRGAWLDTRFALSVPPSDIKMKITTRLGDVTLQNESYEPLIAALSHGPATLRELLEDQSIADLGWSRLQQALGILVGLGHLQPCLPARNEKKRRETTQSLNKEIIRRAKASGDIAYLASPVTGGALAANRFELLFLGARSEGAKTPDDWAASVWQILKGQGQKLIQNGAPIETDADNLAELTRQADVFNTERLPLFKQLQVV